MEEKHENFIAAVRKREMLAATMVKMSGSEKTANGSFWKFHARCSPKQSRKTAGKKCIKSVLHVQSCFSANYTNLIFFAVFVASAA